MSHCDDAKQLEIDSSLSAEVYAGSLCACVCVSLAYVKSAELWWFCWNLQCSIAKSLICTLTYSFMVQWCVYVFSGHDSEYGLESEEVILTPEDENPLRRILQVHTLYFPSTSSLQPLSLYTNTHTHRHTLAHKHNRENSLRHPAWP